MVHACTKSLSETQKNFVPEFPILSALKLPSCGLVIFIVTYCTYIHITKSRNVKIFWTKIMQLRWTAVTVGLFIKKMLNMELNMMLMVALIEFSCTRQP